MRKRVFACIALAFLMACNRPQRDVGQLSSPKALAEPIQGRTPPEVVDELWRLATQGQLLTAQGWQRAARLCTDPIPFARPKVIFIVSNEWGPAFEHNRAQDTAGVTVGFNPVGSIDSTLHYAPAPQTDAVKQGVVYQLVAVPDYTMMYGADGKTLLSKRPTGTRMWQIKGSQGQPFTTVNTAIRNVLEQRDKTQEGVIRKNADETLRILMRLD